MPTAGLAGRSWRGCSSGVPAERIGVSVREPEKARELEERGVRVRRGDFDDPPSLAHAFEGADRVFIVSAPRLGEEGIRLNTAAIGAAEAAGARPRLLHQPRRRQPGLAFPAHARPRRHRGGAAGVGRGLHGAAQRLLRAVCAVSARRRARDGRAARARGRGGLLDRPTPTSPKRPPSPLPMRTSTRASSR